MARREKPHDRRHHEQRISNDADQSEFSAIRDGSALVESGVADDQTAGVMDDFEVDGDMPEWQRTDLRTDNAVGGVAEEIDRRVLLLGENYPFKLSGPRLEYAPREPNVYEFCVAITQSNLTTGEFVGFPRVFERVAARLCADYMGNASKFIHSGTPRDGSASFRNAIDALNAASGEWHWDPDPDLNHKGPPSGDETVDFVVWKDAPDGRQVGQLFLMGQCACGNDWLSKLSELDPAEWRQWARSALVVPPVRVFATPIVMVDAFLRDASMKGGLILDRVRLTKIAAAYRHHFDPEQWRSDIDKLIELAKRGA